MIGSQVSTSVVSTAVAPLMIGPVVVGDEQPAAGHELEGQVRGMLRHHHHEAHVARAVEVARGPIVE